MQVFKTFFKISLRFLPSTIIYIIIFGVLSVILPNIQNNTSNKTFEAQKLNIAVIDRDNSTLSNALYDYLNENHKIVDIGTDEEKWRDRLFYHDVIYILIIEDGMENKIISGEEDELFTAYEDPASNTSYIVASQIDTYISTLKGYLMAGSSIDSAASQTAKTVSLSTDVSFLNTKTAAANTSSVNYYFTYAPYIMLCILINSLGPMLVIWNRKELKARTSISSLSLTKRTGALIGAALAFSVLIFVILICFAVVAFRGEIFNASTGLLLLNAFVYLLVCISITFLISQITKHLNMLNMWSNVIGLSSSFLCGIFVQRSLLPDKVVSFSKYLPTYWYINIVEEVKYSGKSLNSYTWMNLGIQLLFAVAFLAVALAVIKFKEQRSSN